MSHSHLPMESMIQFHDCYCNSIDLDVEEWLKDEDEQFANIERYEAALKDAQAVIPNVAAAPDEFLAPQGNVLQRLLVPHVTIQREVLDPCVPAQSGPVEVPGYPNYLPQQNNELNNITLSSDFHEPFRLAAVTKKRVRWTKEEQRLFLIGIKNYGWGNWKKVSEFVGSKTLSQVASHAQKYSERKNAPEKKKKRKSIHDTALQDTDMMLLHHIDQPNSVPIPNFTMQQPSDLDLAVQQQPNWVPIPNFTMQHPSDLDLAVQQQLNWVSIPNSTMQHPSDLDLAVQQQLNWVPIPNSTMQHPSDLDLAVQQQLNWVPIPNSTMQHPSDLDLAVQQQLNWVPIPNSTMQQQSDLDSAVQQQLNWVPIPNFTMQHPSDLDSAVQQQRNWVPIPNFTMQHPSDLDLAVQQPNWIPIQNFTMQQPSDLDLAVQQQPNWVPFPNFTMQQPSNLDLAVQQFYKRK